MENIGLLANRERPSKMSKVIDEHKIVFVTGKAQNMRGP
jgi:hypothetical protein